MWLQPSRKSPSTSRPASRPVIRSSRQVAFAPNPIPFHRASRVVGDYTGAVGDPHNTDDGDSISQAAFRLRRAAAGVDKLERSGTDRDPLRQLATRGGRETGWERRRPGARI